MGNQIDKICPYCGNKVDEDSVFCDECGAKIPEIKKFKESDGVDKNSEFDDEFENESYTSPVTNPSNSPKSKGVAAVLCFFFGTLGVHRFYVGKIGSGIVMLILSLLSFPLYFIGIGFIFTAILLIWEVVDFFVILFGGFKDGNNLAIK